MGKLKRILFFSILVIATKIFLHFRHGTEEDFHNKFCNSSIPNILLGESFEWWGIPRRNLQCGDKSLKCRLIESFEDPPQFDKAADAVIVIRDGFHVADISFESYVENRNYCPHIKLIYFVLESPYATSEFSITNNKHEMLASYWRGSDFWTPYYLWHNNETIAENQQTEKNHNLIHTSKLEGKNYAEGKSKLAAIVVSNCSPNNDRLGYVEELQKFIPIDVYGDCGDLGCDTENGKKCFESLQDDYKFYLSFENAHCRDYITEKFFFNALQHDMVPVVFGAHPDDYKAQAPKNSFIHVEHFQSQKDLAEYLLMLNNNDMLYNEFFKWKSTGNFVPTNFLCRVCSMLHTMKSNPIESEKYESRLPNGFQWGHTNHEKMCLPPEEWKWVS